MVKLRDAKCPNCGANIEVNESLEKSICQYCGSTVIIEEAIEKYKIELSGKVEVEGIRGRTSKITQARKHLAIDEIQEAEGILLELIKEDSFDVEAYVELLKIYIIKIEKHNFDETSSNLSDSLGWELLDKILFYYKRIEKIDDDKTADKYLGDFKEKVTHYIDFLDKVEKEKIELNELVNILNKNLEKLKRISWPAVREWTEMVSEKEMSHLDFTERSNGDTYRINKYNSISRDGAVSINYKRITETNYSNPKELNLYNREYKKISLQEIRKVIEQIDVDTESFLKKKKKEEKASVKKENSEIKRKNCFLSLGAFLIGVFIVGMAAITIGYVLKGDRDNAILKGIFIDPFVQKFAIKKYKKLKYSIKQNKQKIVDNKTFDKENLSD